jgi:hypothetical protein
MKQKYFIGTKPGITRYQILHKEDCPFLSEAGMKICLGRFLSMNDALAAVRKSHKKITVCRFCSGIHLSQRKYNLVTETTGELNLTLSEIPFLDFTDMFVYCLN